VIVGYEQIVAVSTADAKNVGRRLDLRAALLSALDLDPNQALLHVAATPRR
jgi:hypothetical protein